MRDEVPDCVPACPDISNMVPARLTGKPFWDIYVYQDPPLWKAHVEETRLSIIVPLEIPPKTDESEVG
jgi:hypothetical protein